MSDPNYIEMELAHPTRIQYQIVRPRAGVDVRAFPNRQAAWDALADELAEQAIRQAERIATRVLRDERKNGDVPKRY
jgi:hypothetical protein